MVRALRKGFFPLRKGLASPAQVVAELVPLQSHGQIPLVPGVAVGLLNKVLGYGKGAPEALPAQLYPHMDLLRAELVPLLFELIRAAPTV